MEKGILIGGVIDHEFSNNAQPTLVCRVEKGTEIVKRAVVRIDVEIVGDVIAVILQGRRIKREQPDRADTEFLEIIELLDQSTKIANPIRVAIVKCLHVQLVDDRIL